jgi:molecular chaperone GrpE
VEDHETEATSEEPVAEEPTATPKAEVEEAVDPLERALGERDRFRDKYLREAADHQNFRKRALREMHDKVQQAKRDTLLEILPVIDNLERAVTTSEDATDVKTVIDGVRMVLKLFDEVGERMGLARVATEGERFDPNLHDALQQVETSDVEPGTIVAELVPGYRVGERLLRPAMVVVARKPSTEGASDQEPDADA